MIRVLIVLVVLLAGCIRGQKVAPLGEPEMVLGLARSRSLPFALQARFKVQIRTKEFGGSTDGILLIRRPDRFRLELLTPMGTPLLYLVSDGTALHAWMQRDRTFYRGDDAGEVLRSLTGGAVGLDDVVAVLTASIPMHGAAELPSQEGRFEAEGLVLVLQGPEDLRVRTVVDPRTGLVRKLDVVHQPESDAVLPVRREVVSVRYEDIKRVGRSRLPETIHITLPTLGWEIEIEVHTWEELGRIPDAFSLSPPPGATEKNLVKALEKLAENHGVRPPQ